MEGMKRAVNQQILIPFFPANCFYTLQPVFIVRDLEEEKKKEMKGNQLYKMATSPLGRLFWLETKGYFRKII